MVFGKVRGLAVIRPGELGHCGSDQVSCGPVSLVSDQVPGGRGSLVRGQGTKLGGIRASLVPVQARLGPVRMRGQDVGSTSAIEIKARAGVGSHHANAQISSGWVWASQALTASRSSTEKATSSRASSGLI